MIFVKTQIIKVYYCYGSGNHMLNNCEIIDTIAKDQYFDKKLNMNSNHQKEADKRYEQTVVIHTYVSVSSTKTSSCSG